MKVISHIHAPILPPREKVLGAHWIGGWVRITQNYGSRNGMPI